MTDYLGRKVNLVCKDGKKFSGYVFDVVNAEDSDIGSDCIEIAPIDREVIIVIAVEDILEIQIDKNYKFFDFRH
ncbi:MAG: hypothetical protein IKG47_04400 [Oscillospiraceae bacterium]|nr:hypothetical protein [Oscillospiraceae bacterium]